ncbi:MAG TPA: hypothetical protein VKS21_01785, partial [Spirochaetota bacterium]|nr:hypothetical protein [Spirochaetota bacterium]
LNSDHSPAKINIYFEAAATTAAEYKLQYLTDGSDPDNDTWINLTNVAGNSMATVEHTNITAAFRYLRLYISDPIISSPNPQWGLKFFEIQVWK